MKKYIYFIICAVSLIFITCPGETGIPKDKEDYSIPYIENNSEKVWQYIQNYIESDVPISDVRPFPNVLSEKEALLKAYKVMYMKGYFSLNNSMFKTDPRLLTAKAARPLMIHYFMNGWAGVAYRLYAITDNGEVLIEQYINPIASDSEDEFLFGQSGYGRTSQEHAYHFITEGELIELIESQFDSPPDETPILIQFDLAGHPYNDSVPFWYFTVDDVEYIVGATVSRWNYTAAAGGIANHDAISKPGGNGIGSLGGERMARLDTRADFYKTLRENRETAIDNGFAYTPPAPEFQWTAIPLK
ncbi:MAG: hypothetical protein LBB22_01505 [Treponema sp.]|jgi:hypothetical protein|nr:hypothetical protein [Treponema sp.]